MAISIQYPHQHHWWSSLLDPEVLRTYRPVEAAEGRTAHNNIWNGVNGMVSKCGFLMVETIPLTPFQPLLWAALPQQPPLVQMLILQALCLEVLMTDLTHLHSGRPAQSMAAPEGEKVILCVHVIPIQ
jgi:hypothetical protein